MTDYVLRVPAGILLPHFSSSSSPPSPVWNAPDHLCVHIVDWGSKTGRYCEILAKGFLDLRQFLLLRYGCCACVCWRLVSRHDFFFHVDQFLVQLIFYFIQRLQSYNPTSSKLNNAETVWILKEKNGRCRFRCDLIHCLRGAAITSWIRVWKTFGSTIGLLPKSPSNHPRDSHLVTF